MRRRTAAFWAGYLSLLAASTLVRSGRDRPPAPAPWERGVTVAEVSGDREGRTPVQVSVFDSGPSARPDAPVLVLIHGSPGDNREVTRLARLLAARYRVVAPDLPGFGGSTRQVPDYSIRAHARYVAELLDSLHIARASVLGFSMGGGVALNLADIAPERVRSIILLSAIGAQEYELLGEYSLNHAIHGLQLGGLWLLHNAIPQFGVLEDGMLTREYARNFYDSDQRPLRGILSRLTQPALIIQGRSDPLVPAAIGEEHRRLVPQSKLILLDGDHFMAFQHPALLADSIGAFLEGVEAGTATTRATAPPERLAEAARPFDPRSAPGATGIGFVVLMLLLAAATLVSEDLTCIAAGLLVSRGTVGYLPATIACMVGICGGDLLLFAAGRLLGRPAIRRAPFRWLVTTEELTRTSAWFSRRGPALVLTSRFIPGTRLPTYLAAGILHTPLLPFLGWFVLAAALWTPLLVGVATVYGASLVGIFGTYRRWTLPVLLVAGLILLVVVKLLVPLTSWRGRRMLLGRWRRLTRWEFWPPWLFYPPVAARVVRLGLRHRSLTLFTAANPAIPGGGVLGESKWEILQGLRAEPGRLPATLFLPAGFPPGDRLRQIQAFRAGHGLGWPLVLKPDVGERGRGVLIARSEAELAGYLERQPAALLAQEYLPGREFGVFYYRIPGQTTGQIFAITDKRLPSVVGDGCSTLETLILRDERAVCIAPRLFLQHAAGLWGIPAAGEVVPLVELGTHARGAVFFDGADLRTSALERAVDRMSRRFDGFWFGRYDVRADSVEAFQRGEFRVVELNGVTSEATSIYDPKYRLREAYRILGEQWRICFEIGARNRDAGARPATVRELFQLARRAR